MADASFIDQLQEVARRQGKPFIDPTHIQGFGNGAPPPPPLREEEVKIPSAVEMFGGPALEPVQEESPLIRAGMQGFTPPTATPVPQFDMTSLGEELMVLGTKAAYLGRHVDLSSGEKAAVSAVILKALRRVVSEQFAEIEKLIPKRTRRKRMKPTVVARDPQAVPIEHPETPVPKKRGRPRKIVA